MFPVGMDEVREGEGEYEKRDIGEYVRVDGRFVRFVGVDRWFMGIMQRMTNKQYTSICSKL